MYLEIDFSLYNKKKNNWKGTKQNQEKKSKVKNQEYFDYTINISYNRNMYGWMYKNFLNILPFEL